MPRWLRSRALLLTSVPFLLGDLSVLGQRDLRLEPTGKRLALVIGNNAYARAPLKNAANDARVMGQALQKVRFQSEVLVDANARSMEAGVNQFASRLSAGDVAVFYFAGHGVQIDGENYLIPTDFDGHDEADVKYHSLSASWVQEKLDKTGAQLKIVILDACRNNPFRVSRGAGGGLAQMQGGRGSFIAFATAAGKVASDNVQDNNGLFTKHLAARIQQPGLSLDEVFNSVRADVDQASTGQQLPYIYSGVIGQFYFAPKTAPGPFTPDPNAYYRLTLKHSKKCFYMDFRGVFGQYLCDDTDAMAFQFKPAEGGYRISPKARNGCIEVPFGIEENGALFALIRCGNGGRNEIFDLKPVGDGYHQIVVRHSGKCMTVSNASTTGGMPIMQWGCLPGETGPHQMFRIEPWTLIKDR